MQMLDNQELQTIEGGVAPGGCTPPIFDEFPFPIFF